MPESASTLETSGGESSPSVLLPKADFPWALYAKYERSRGGLLHVLQGLLWLIQAGIGPRVESRSIWSLLIFLPVYLVYFPARRYLWRRLYRPLGHVENERETVVARFYAWWVPVLGTFLVYNAYRGGVFSVPLVAAVAWGLVTWVPVLLWGRIMADYLHYAGHYLLILYEIGGMPLSWFRWLFLLPATLVIAGLIQHCVFQRSLEAYGDVTTAAPAGLGSPAEPSSAETSKEQRT